jgi:hypothetical protein
MLDLEEPVSGEFALPAELPSAEHFFGFREVA